VHTLAGGYNALTAPRAVRGRGRFSSKAIEEEMMKTTREKSSRIATVVLAAAILAASAIAVAPARAADLIGNSLTLEAYGGWQNLNINNPATSVANATKGNEGTAIIGGDVLAKLTLFGVGLTLDKTVSGNGGQPWAGALLAGVVFDLLPSLRIEGLGEAGRLGGDFGDMFRSNGSWFLGVRPGVSFRLLPTPLRFGISGLVRWPTSGGDIGSPNYGIVGRIGFEIS
jgi:hypothetical protein